MRIRNHGNYGHGLTPGTDHDMNCASCTSERLIGMTPDIEGQEGTTMNSTDTRSLADTTTRPLTDILADLNAARSGTAAINLYHELEDTLNARLAPLPEGEAERMAAEADRAARTMAPPAPDVTRNAGYTVRAVLPGHPAEPGLLESWWVAAEDADRSAWVTWEAYKMDGTQAGKLAYNAGTYFDTASDPEVNRRRALADLSVRAGLMPTVALRIADEMIHGDGRVLDPVQPAARRAASYLRRRYGR